MKYLFLSLLFLFSVVSSTSVRDTTDEITQLTPEAFPYTSISCFRIANEATFVTFDFANSLITNTSLFFNSSFVQIYGILQQTDTYVGVFYFDVASEKYRIGYFYYANTSFVEGPALTFPDETIIFVPQATYYNSQSNQILIGGVDANYKIVTVSLNLNTMQSSYIKSSYKVYNKIVPNGGVGVANQVLTFYYSGSDQGSPYLAITNVTTQKTSNFKLQGYQYDTNNPPYVYPVASDNGQIYLVSIDLPTGNKANTIALYGTAIVNNDINVKMLFHIPYGQYMGGTEFFVDKNRENIIFIGSPIGKDSEIEFLTYNFEENIVTNTTIDNPSYYNFYEYSNYFTR